MIYFIKLKNIKNNNNILNKVFKIDNFFTKKFNNKYLFKNILNKVNNKKIKIFLNKKNYQSTKNIFLLKKKTFLNRIKFLKKKKKLFFLKKKVFFFFLKNLFLLKNPKYYIIILIKKNLN